MRQQILAAGEGELASSGPVFILTEVTKLDAEIANLVLDDMIWQFGLFAAVKLRWSLLSVLAQLA